MSTNNNNPLIKRLIDFGMSEKEAKVYLALLELEIANVNEVAKTSGINRSSAYVVLEALKKRGIVGISDDKKVRRYIATTPEVLLQIAERQAKKQEEVRKNIDDIVPELKAMFKGTKTRPKVMVFEGRDGLIAAFEDTYKSKEKIMRVSSSPGNLGHIIGDFLPQYIKNRFKLNIKMFGIHPDDEIHRKIVENSPKNFDKSVLIPVNKYKFPADFAIFDDTIGFMSAENGGTAILIESKEIAEVMKNIFDMAFKEAKRLSRD